MGAYVLMGSGEFLPWAEEPDRWAIDQSPLDSDRVVISPAAAAPEGDGVFDFWASKGLEHFAGMGLKPEVLGVKTREDASDPDVLERIAGARYIFFSGGNPAVLVEVLEDTPAWKTILEAVANGTSLGGCSAGVGALGVTAPDTRSHEERPRGAWVPGLNLFSKAFFGVHWDMLDVWEPGLTEKILEAWPEDSVLFAVDEETAACGDGTTWTVHGRGGLTIPGVDGLERIVSGGKAVIDLGPVV